MSPGASLPSTNGSTMGLGTVFNDIQVIVSGEFHDSRHVGWVSVKVDRNNGFNVTVAVLFNRLFQAIGVHRKSRWVNVYKHRRSASQFDGSHSRNSSVGDGDDGITGTDAADSQ